jgi:HK97 gp10 family phage protein
MGKTYNLPLGGKLVVEITGLEELQHGLRALDRELAGQVIDAALTAGALPIQNAWKQDVAQGPNRAIDTGTYLRSINHELVDDEEGYRSVVIGTNIVDPPYPYFVEYGTRYMAARPAMRTAFDQHKDEAVAEVTGVINELLANYGAQ